MRRFYLSDGHNPIVWPAPELCVWNAAHVETYGKIRIEAEKCFENETRLLEEGLAGTGLLEISDDESAATVKLVKSSGESDFGEEGYSIEAEGENVRVAANGRRGMVYGCQTLLQMIDHGCDGSIRGAKITDRPRKNFTFRGIKLTLPAAARASEVINLIKLASKWKYNKIILRLENNFEISNGVAEAASRYGIDIVPSVTCSQASDAGFLERLLSSVSFALAEVCFNCCDCADSDGLSDCVNKIRSVFTMRGIRLAVSSARLHPETGGRKLIFNDATRSNDVIPPTFEALDKIPKDVLIFAEGSEKASHFAERGFDVAVNGLPELAPKFEKIDDENKIVGAFVEIDANVTPLGRADVVTMARLSCVLWSGRYAPDKTSHGAVLPDYFERAIAQIYPKERDALTGIKYPSASNPGVISIDLSPWYNMPLQNAYWRLDDHFMMFLENMMNLPNAIPFAYFIGTDDFRTDNAFAYAGGNRNKGVFGIKINKHARSVAFLHTYIFGKQQVLKGRDYYDGKVVGRYAIRYSDGICEHAPVVYGRDILYYSDFYGSGAVAYDANATVKGISPEGMHYALYAMEWINPRPGAEIATIDLIPVNEGDVPDGRIGLFAISLVQGGIENE